MHLPEGGGLDGLVAVVGVGHGVGHLLDDSKEGEHCGPVPATELVPGVLDGAAGPVGLLARHLHDQPYEAGQQGRLSWHGVARVR